MGRSELKFTVRFTVPIPTDKQKRLDSLEARAPENSLIWASRLALEINTSRHVAHWLFRIYHYIENYTKNEM